VRPISVTSFPNPFNPTTNISFNLPRATEVEINIYNIRGQRVKNVVNGFMNTGNHVVSWDGVDNNGRSTSSGIYFVSVKANGFDRVVRKVTLLK
jgi:flagellar hook assembly protein FlgD